MANSPSGGEKNKMLPDDQKQLSDAEQRPGVSGESAPDAPGEKSSGITSDALKSAQVC
ncbi:hypothetical protein BCR39DRAFT_542063 [Naematelia encephala]|uniref:Uncharacterized protein n=1 Tax=Naematelia encephala TaxID=71784 RepID=A0A1Y2AUK7_9TREE|nr:hypothetical protein BCR39DRAFT_542063 [Naematelia encephala]